MTYKKVYFRIKSDYIFDRGWPSENQKLAFQNETAGLFQESGWTFHPSTSSSASDTVTKGWERLYLHPMNFSGEVLENEIPVIQALLKQAATFKHYHTDIYEEYVEMNDEEYLALLASRKEEILHALLSACKTKRRNLYVCGDIVGRVAKQFSIRRICDRDKYGNKANLFVSKLFEKLIADGRILTASTRNGMGFQTVPAYLPAAK